LLPHATPGETLAYLNEVVVPNLAKGVIIRRPGAVGMAERLDLDRRAIRRLQQLRRKYGAGPLIIPLPLRPQAVILSAEHVHHVLKNSPEPFATAETMKKSALRHFEPKVALISHGTERAERRKLNEQVLQTDRPVHDLAERFLPVIQEEAQELLARVRHTGELDWDVFIEAWYRTVRRVVLGDSAREDHALTDLLAELRANANWAFLRPADEAQRERFLDRLHEHLARAEPGSLAALMAGIPKSETAAATQQVPQWLFAFDPAGMTSFRTLGLLSTHPRHAERAQEEIATRRNDPDLPFLRACVLESLRLWPTTPAILRESTVETEWENGVLPAGTSILIFAPYFHRDDEKLDYADRFTPELWLRERDENDWPLVPFSGGAGVCPARNLVLLLTSNMLAAVLDGRELRQRPPTRLLKSQPLPATLNNYTFRFTLSERSALSQPARPRRQASQSPLKP
jgi:cytochrome P450